VLPVGTHEFNDTSDTLLEKNSADIDSFDIFDDSSSTTITKSGSAEINNNVSLVKSKNVQGKSYLDLTYILYNITYK